MCEEGGANLKAIGCEIKGKMHNYHITKTTFFIITRHQYMLPSNPSPIQYAQLIVHVYSCYDTWPVRILFGKGYLS